MWLRSSSISLDGYGSKIRKVSRRRPEASNETVLATRQEFFFTQLVPMQSITDIVFLDFRLILLSWMFISSYTVFEPVTREFQLATRGFELITCRFELVTCRFTLVARWFELLIRKVERTSRGFELALLNLNSCFQIFNS